MSDIFGGRKLETHGFYIAQKSASKSASGALHPDCATPHTFTVPRDLYLLAIKLAGNRGGSVGVKIMLESKPNSDKNDVDTHKDALASGASPTFSDEAFSAPTDRFSASGISEKERKELTLPLVEITFASGMSKTSDVPNAMNKTIDNVDPRTKNEGPMGESEVHDAVKTVLDNLDGKDFAELLSARPMSKEAVEVEKLLKEAERRGSLDDVIKGLNAELEKRGSDFRLNIDKSDQLGQMYEPSGIPLPNPRLIDYQYHRYDISVSNIHTGSSTNGFNFDDSYRRFQGPMPN